MTTITGLDDFVYKCNTIYSITIAPCDKYQFFGKERLSKFRDYFYKKFADRWCDYLIYIEISEPTGLMDHKHQGARLHIHGFIKFTSISQIQNFLLSGMRSLCQVGRTAIDIPHYINVWFVYCTKQALLPDKVRRLSNFSDPEEFFILNPKGGRTSKRSKIS